MAAPTLSGTYVTSTWNSGSTRTATGVAWSTGDLILVKGQIENNPLTLTTPTNANLTFSALSGFPSNTSSQTKEYVWQATAASSQSGQTISTTPSNVGDVAGIIVEVWSGSAGVGTISSILNGASTSVSGSISCSGANSAVSCGLGDWGAAAVSGNATNNTSSTGTFEHAVNHTGMTTYWWYYADMGSAGTKTYGMSNANSLDYLAYAVEVLGTAVDPPGPVKTLKRYR